MIIKERAPAKINYWLSVGEREENGYHPIKTIMQTVSLFDDVTVSVDEGDEVTVSIPNNSGIPTDESNLAVRATRVFFAHYGKKAKIGITLVKNIPHAGGMGGGSADAAAVLRALNRAFQYPFTKSDLMAMAAEFGSDISFCVEGGLAVCTGRGEIVESIDSRPVLHHLISNMGERVSTAEAYAEIDRVRKEINQRTDISYRHEDCLEALMQGDVRALGAEMYNAFENVVFPGCPLAESMKKAFQLQGGAALMSGSGSTVFAVFPTAKDALSAQSALPFPTLYATSYYPNN